MMRRCWVVQQFDGATVGWYLGWQLGGAMVRWHGGGSTVRWVVAIEFLQFSVISPLKTKFGCYRFFYNFL
ncbi:hypothetical protein HanXRQr2_Chr11g0474171 [Helianthus annuus]|uniref:Uncharacterized protein n=1 Tax=Helianthus annuus TaxID=4232 RepID=A0A9K3MYM9_HELAN|nr:hypothetical protein HanXRQr2_Chr11g0474171 [Helianthus annuus]